MPESSTAISHEKAQSIKIRIVFGPKVMTAELDNNATARDFVSLLPLTVTLRDYGYAEKVSDALSRHLSEAGVLERGAGKTGEIAYYAPWRNIAFYRGQDLMFQALLELEKYSLALKPLSSRVR